MRKTQEIIENRNAVRFPLKLKMEVKGETWQGEAETWNVSSGGVLFHSEEEVSLGSQIEFAITMPARVLGTPANVLVNCVGRVVRCSDQGKYHAVAAVIDEYRFERA